MKKTSIQNPEYFHRLLVKEEKKEKLFKELIELIKEPMELSEFENKLKRRVRHNCFIS